MGANTKSQSLSLQSKDILANNNPSLDFNLEVHPPEVHVIIEVLRNHVLYTALTLEREVSNDLLVKVYETSSYDSVENKVTVAYMDGYVFSFSLNTFKKVFKFPESGEFADSPKFPLIVETLAAIGYVSPETIGQSSNFKRMNLPPIWYYLFTIINKCLTGKKSSHDQSSKLILDIFWGIINNSPLDYGLLLWTSFVRSIGDKSKAGYLQFQRFWAVIIAEKRTLKHIVDKYSSGTMRKPWVLGDQNLKKHLVAPFKIPETMLNCLPDNNPVKMKYLELIPPGEPLEVTPSSNPDTDSSRVTQGSQSGENPGITSVKSPHSESVPKKSGKFSQKNFTIEQSSLPETTDKDHASHLFSSQKDTSSRDLTHNLLGVSKNTSGIETNTTSPQGMFEKSTTQPISITNFDDTARSRGSSYAPPASRQAFQESLTSFIAEFGVDNIIQSAQQIEYQRQMEASHRQELLIHQLLQILYPTVSSEVLEPMTNTHRLLAISYAKQALQIESLQTQIKEMQKFQYSLLTSALHRPGSTKDISTALVEIFKYNQYQKGDSGPSSSSDNHAKFTKIQEQSSRGFTPVQEGQDIVVKKTETEKKEYTLDMLPKSLDSHLTTLATNNIIYNLYSKEVSKMKTQMETIASIVASVGDPNKTKGERGTKRTIDSPSGGNEPKRQRKDKEIINLSPESDFDEGDPDVVQGRADDETKKLKEVMEASKKDFHEKHSIKMSSGNGQSSCACASSALIKFSSKPTEPEFDLNEPSRVGAPKPLLPIPMMLEHSTDLQDHTNRDANITSWSSHDKKKERFIARHKSKNSVWSKVDIAEVTKCRIGTFEKSFDYSEVLFTRKDGSKWIVNDADYPDMHPCDWMQIADLLFKKIHTKKATGAEIAVYRRLKAMLAEYIKPWTSRDVEVARMYKLPIDESFRPSLPPAGLDKVPGGSLVSDPEPGLVYDVLEANEKVERHFFRLFEVPKYSNEKLDTFLTILTGCMSPCEFIRKQGIEKINHWKEVREMFQRMKTTIEHHWQTR